MEISWTSEILNRKSCEGLVHLALESQSEVTSSGVTGNFVKPKVNSLHLIFDRLGEIWSLIHNICAELTHSLRAINITILRIANTAASFVHVPVVVRKSLGLLIQETTIHSSSSVVVEGNNFVGFILNVRASAVARAIVGACCALTSLALVSREAFTFTGISVANTSISTFSVSMMSTTFVGCINPCKLIGANSLRAVARVVVQANTPVVVALANIIEHASSVSTALIVAGSLNIGQDN